MISMLMMQILFTVHFFSYWNVLNNINNGSTGELNFCKLKIYFFHYIDYCSLIIFQTSFYTDFKCHSLLDCSDYSSIFQYYNETFMKIHDKDCDTFRQYSLSQLPVFRYEQVRTCFYSTESQESKYGLLAISANCSQIWAVMPSLSSMYVRPCQRITNTAGLTSGHLLFQLFLNNQSKFFPKCNVIIDVGCLDNKQSKTLLFQNISLTELTSSRLLLVKDFSFFFLLF